jgi:hypothetical protein
MVVWLWVDLIAHGPDVFSHIWGMSYLERITFNLNLENKAPRVFTFKLTKTRIEALPDSHYF